MSEPGTVPLRDALMRGGAALMTRELAGIAMSLVAVAVVFRRVGPEGYGLLGVAIAAGGYVNRFGSLGLDVFVIRHPGPVDRELARRLVGAVLLLATGFALGVFLLAPSIAAAFGLPEATGVVRLAAPFVWGVVAARGPIALLEHRLQLRTVARIEFAGICSYHAVALALVFGGAGYRSVAVALVVQAVVSGALAFAKAGTMPSFRVLGPDVARALRYGLSYQGSVWVWALRDLAAPILIGRALGGSALGIVTGAFLLLNRVAFMRSVVWRVSLAGLAKVQDDPERVRRGISKGMAYQVVTLGTIFAVVTVLGPLVVPTVVGQDWARITELFPFLAFGALVNAGFGMHASALFAVGRVRDMTMFHIAHVATLWLAGLVLVPTFGLLGYGIAEVVAVWPHWLLHRWVRGAFGRPDHRAALAAGIGACVTIFVGAVLPLAAAAGALALSALVAVAASRELRSTVIELVRAAVGFRRRASTRVEVAA